MVWLLDGTWRFTKATFAIAENDRIIVGDERTFFGQKSVIDSPTQRTVGQGIAHDLMAGDGLAITLVAARFVVPRMGVTRRCQQ